MVMLSRLLFMFCVALPASAHAIEPSDPSEKYRAMSQRCRDVENGLRTSPGHVPSALKLYLASDAQCDYRGDDPHQWRG